MHANERELAPIRVDWRALALFRDGTLAIDFFAPREDSRLRPKAALCYQFTAYLVTPPLSAGWRWKHAGSGAITRRRLGPHRSQAPHLVFE